MSDIYNMSSGNGLDFDPSLVLDDAPKHTKEFVCGVLDKKRIRWSHLGGCIIITLEKEG